MAYHNILVAVDLGATTERLLTAAKGLMADSNSEVHVLHVVEPINISYGADIPMDLSTIQDEIYDQASEQLTQYGESYGIPESHRHLAMGHPEAEIANAAKQLNAEVIALGRHERYGLALLLGSTTDGVLHHAGCDVLAVHVDPPNEES
ncbi:MAG: universal stress protein [Luminiphilus sp.]|nr:universal stress protein [Luminiphilus sp.]